MLKQTNRTNMRIRMNIIRNHGQAIIKLGCLSLRTMTLMRIFVDLREEAKYRIECSSILVEERQDFILR